MGTPIPLFYDKHMIAIQSQSDFPFLGHQKVEATTPFFLIPVEHLLVSNIHF